MHKYKKMVIIALLIIILSIGIGIGIYKFNLTGAKAIAKEELVPENFVKNHLYEANGLLKTDLLKQKNVYLSESIGLWMIYLVEKHDQQEFDKQLEVLKTHFMKDSTLIPWRIVGDEQASTNALIDD
ncbi:glycosyl hydrolase lipoprotein, partial [Butyricicoccus sp. 1XD8-22]